MTEPVDAIRAFHNAFRNDIRRIDTAAFEAAKGMGGRSTEIERYRFFNEVLVWHASGEEAGVFPAIETVAPSVAEAYVMDHRGLDRAFDDLNDSYAPRDPLKTARATAVFHFHLGHPPRQGGCPSLPDIQGKNPFVGAKEGIGSWLERCLRNDFLS